MKKILILILFVFGVTGSFAQIPLCKPDSSYLNKPANIYPSPFHPRLNPKGGVLDSACINKDYKFVFTVVVPDSFQTPLGQVKLDSIVIAKNGILFAPKGIKYACNPPNCKYKAGTLGCLELYGKPTAENAVKVYDLKLKVKITALFGLIVINDTLPDFISDSAHYYLPLFEENSPNCKTTAADEFFAQEINLVLSPNPSDEMLNITFDTPQASRCRYSIVDLTGKEILVNEKNNLESRVMFVEDISYLKKGMYLFVLEVSGRKIIQRFVVN
ncbi:MAG: T9SS type A sorting domain-containing protein [Deltaproteobacteria bacterium]